MTLEEAVASFRNHDERSEEAFRVIYEDTRCTALAVIRRYCDIPEDYEDLLQETYIKVYKSIDTLRDNTKIMAWIRSIAGNIAIRHNMKKWPAMFSEKTATNGNIPEVEDEDGTFNPEKIADRKAVSEAVAQILASLPADQRAALWMVYGQQVTIREMAAGLGISENTIKSRLYQGRQKLMQRKDDFRKYGIELTAIPLSALVAMAFHDTVYAADAATAAGAAFHSSGKWGKKTGLKGMKAVKHAKKAEKIAATAAGTAKKTALIGKIATASVGVKAAAIGVGAAVIAAGGIAGGAAVSHANKTYREPEEVQAEAYEESLYDSETEADGSLQDEKDREADEASRKEINKNLLSYSRNLLEYDSNFNKVSTHFGVVDVNRDGIYEVYANVEGISNAESAAYLIYARDDGHCEYTALLDDVFGYIPEKNQILAFKYHMGIAVQVFELQGDGLQECDNFLFYSRDDVEYGQNSEQNDRYQEKFDEYCENMIEPALVEATPDNIERYLGGDGLLTGEYSAEDYDSAADDPEPEAISSDTETGQAVDLNTEIEHIRQTYAYTNAHIDEYEKTSVNKNTDVWGNTCDNTYFYDGDVQVKQIVEDDGFYIEIYGKNPAITADAKPTQEVFPEEMAEFVFAKVDGAEYRIYMKDAMVIRYIGPDHVNVDYVQPENLDEFCIRDVKHNGDMITQIVNRAFPGWWVPYEGEGN